MYKLYYHLYKIITDRFSTLQYNSARPNSNVSQYTSFYQPGPTCVHVSITVPIPRLRSARSACPLRSPTSLSSLSFKSATKSVTLELCNVRFSTVRTKPSSHRESTTSSLKPDESDGRACPGPPEGRFDGKRAGHGRSEMVQVSLECCEVGAFGVLFSLNKTPKGFVLTKPRVSALDAWPEFLHLRGNHEEMPSLGPSVCESFDCAGRPGAPCC